MSTSTTSAFLNRLRQTLKPSLAPTDGQLLESFVNQGDPAAFESLVVRHGPMVLGVCRRLLRHEADVADAFQATFLVLVRRASRIRPRGMVGNWLHGVARNTARKARAMSRRALPVESERIDPSPSPEERLDRELLHAILDEELTRLPDIYRAAIVLCDLEGKTIKQTARELGCPQGTVATRLTRGRALLAKRLAARGLAVSAAALPSLLAPRFLGAAVPSELLNFTCQSVLSGATSAPVAALAKGVLTTMLLKKLKLITAFVVAGLICVGMGLGGRPEAVAQVKAEPAKSNPTPPSTQDGEGKPKPPKEFPSPLRSMAFLKREGTGFKMRCQTPQITIFPAANSKGESVEVCMITGSRPEPFNLEGNDVRITDTRGNPKSPKEIAFLFEEETLVFLLIDSKGLDSKQIAKYYGLYREDLLVVFVREDVFPKSDHSDARELLKSILFPQPTETPKPENEVKERKR